MTVGASGTPTLTYQWYIGASGNTASPIGGATASSYTTPPLSTATSYWVRVSNAFGTANSTTAIISIGVPPSITAQPQSQPIVSGSTTTLSVAATGTPPLTYQWYVGASGNTASPIGGATSSSYTTPPLTTATSYWVRVLNLYGIADSITATITMCAYALTPTSASFGPTGGSGSIGVATQSACPWSASPPPTWITFGAGSGTGAGTLTFTVLKNPTGLRRSSSITVGGQVFAVVQRIAFGDFDGDAKADVTVFRPSTGGWYTLRSSTGNTTSAAYSWGLSTDLPQPGDYDGDGKTDPTVFRRSTGGWYILESSTNYTSSKSVSWGLSSDVPVPGDYDGDGKADPAVFRPSTGGWYVLKSSTN